MKLRTSSPGETRQSLQLPVVGSRDAALWLRCPGRKSRPRRIKKKGPPPRKKDIPQVLVPHWAPPVGGGRRPGGLQGEKGGGAPRRNPNPPKCHVPKCLPR